MATKWIREREQGKNFLQCDFKAKHSKFQYLRLFRKIILNKVGKSKCYLYFSSCSIFFFFNGRLRKSVIFPSLVYFNGLQEAFADSPLDNTSFLELSCYSYFSSSSYFTFPLHNICQVSLRQYISYVIIFSVFFYIF